MPTLDFKGKSVIETYHHTVAHYTLEFDPKLSLLPKGQKPSLQGNLIIEGDNLPPFKEIAKYVFYTETSRECDLAKVDEQTGFIGSTEAAGGTSYYLFYTPNRREDMELSLDTLAKLAKKDKNRNWVIYCQRIWLHADQLRKFRDEKHIRVRPMLVPFNLK